MFVPAELIPQSVSWTAWLLWVFALSAAAISAPWHAMRLPQRQHLFFASLLGLMLLWRLEAGVAPGRSGKDSLRAAGVVVGRRCCRGVGPKNSLDIS